MIDLTVLIRVFIGLFGLVILLPGMEGKFIYKSFIDEDGLDIAVGIQGVPKSIW